MSCNFFLSDYYIYQISMSGTDLVLWIFFNSNLVLHGFLLTATVLKFGYVLQCCLGSFLHENLFVTFVTDASAVWWMNLAINTRQDLGSWKGVDCLSVRTFVQHGANLHPIHRQFFVLNSTAWDRHTVLAQSKISCMKLRSLDQFKVQHSIWKYA